MGENILCLLLLLLLLVVIEVTKFLTTEEADG